MPTLALIVVVRGLPRYDRIKTKNEDKEHCTDALVFILTRVTVDKFVIFKNYKFPNYYTD